MAHIKHLWRSIERSVIDIAAGIVIIACIVALASLVGCGQPAPAKTADVAGTGEGIKSRAVDILNRAEKIDHASAEVAKVAPEPAAAIRVDAAGITADAHAIHADAGSLRAAQDQLDKLAQENARLKDEAGRSQHRLLLMLQVFAGIAIPVCIALMLWGTLRTALPVLLAVAVLLGTLMLQVVLDYALWIGAGCAVAIAISVAWQVYAQHKTFGEVVKTVDATLRDANDTIAPEFANKARAIQSDLTHALIDRVQGNGPLAKFRRWLGGVIGGGKIA